MDKLLENSWINIPTIRPQNGDNILAQLHARLPNGLPRLNEIDMKAHYGTHFLNNYIRNNISPYKGWENGNCGYFSGGSAIVLPVPKIKLRNVLEFVDGAMNLWSSAIPHWNNNALYVLDEISAYTNSLQAQIEEKSNNYAQMQNDYKNAMIGVNCMEAIMNLSRHYTHSSDIYHFIIWCSKYLNELKLSIKF